MKKHVSFFKIRLIQGLQYQTAAYVGILTQFMWGAMGILLFSALYHSEPEAFPMGSPQPASYYWSQRVFLALFMTWLMEEEIFQAISNGTVAYELCRPVDIYSTWFVKGLANRAFKVVLRCIPILLTALFLPKPHGLALSPDVKTVVLFLLSMILGFLVAVAFSMLIYVTMFFALSLLGTRTISLSLVEFMSGGIISLPFSPGKIRGTMEPLPFVSMQNAPYRIYSANTTGAAVVSILSLQLFWAIVLTVLDHCLMSLALKHVVIQGG